MYFLVYRPMGLLLGGLISGVRDSRDLIGLAAMVYKPLSHGQEIATTVKLSSSCSCKVKSARPDTISRLFLIKQFISLVLVGYDMIIANSRHTTCWLIIISYPMCAHGIIVKYTGAKGDMTTVEHLYVKVEKIVIWQLLRTGMYNRECNKMCLYT